MAHSKALDGLKDTPPSWTGAVACGTISILLEATPGFTQESCGLGSLGGSEVERLPSAQGMIPGLPAGSLLLPLLCLCLSLYFS